MSVPPPSIVVDTTVRVPCTCGVTTVWPHVAGGRGLSTVEHPTDAHALVQHVDDGPCGRVWRCRPDCDCDTPAVATAGPAEPVGLFDLEEVVV